MTGHQVNTVTHAAECHYCGKEVHWTTAAWEPDETEAPIDAAGNYYCCDDCLPADR